MDNGAFTVFVLDKEYRYIKQDIDNADVFRVLDSFAMQETEGNLPTAQAAYEFGIHDGMLACIRKYGLVYTKFKEPPALVQIVTECLTNTDYTSIDTPQVMIDIYIESFRAGFSVLSCGCAPEHSNILKDNKNVFAYKDEIFND